MTAEAYKKVEAYMHEYMSDSAHDREHVYRVLYNALSIDDPAAAEGRRGFL